MFFTANFSFGKLSSKQPFLIFRHPIFFFQNYNYCQGFNTNSVLNICGCVDVDMLLAVFRLFSGASLSDINVKNKLDQIFYGFQSDQLDKLLSPKSRNLTGCFEIWFEISVCTNHEKIKLQEIEESNWVMGNNRVTKSNHLLWRHKTDIINSIYFV